MSNLTLHVQYIPEWFGEFIDRCQGKLRYLVGVGVYPIYQRTRALFKV